MNGNTSSDTSVYPCPCGESTVTVTVWKDQRVQGGGPVKTEGKINCHGCTLIYFGRDSESEYVLTRRDADQPNHPDYERHSYPPTTNKYS